MNTIAEKVMSRHEVEKLIRQKLADLKENPTKRKAEELASLVHAFMLFVDRDPEAPASLPMTIHNEAGIGGNHSGKNGGMSVAFVAGGIMVGLVIASLIIVIIHLVSELHAMGRQPFSGIVETHPIKKDIEQWGTDEARDALVRSTLNKPPEGTEARRRLDEAAKAITVPPDGYQPIDERTQTAKYRAAWAAVEEQRKRWEAGRGGTDGRPPPTP